MVRVSGFLDEGTDVRRSVSSRGRHEATSRTVGNSLTTRRLQHYHPAEHASDRVHRGLVDNDERISRRPQPQHFGTNNSTSSQQIKHQSTVEMRPLLCESESNSSILAPVTSQTTYDSGEELPNNTATSFGTQAINHRNTHYSNLTTHQVPGPTRLLAPYYHTQVSDDEEGDIVCCDDCYQHEGTKNICTIFIWAMAVFFVTNRFFVHMSNYLRQDGDEVTDRIVTAGSNYSSIIDMSSGP